MQSSLRAVNLCSSSPVSIDYRGIAHDVGGFDHGRADIGFSHEWGHVLVRTHHQRMCTALAGIYLPSPLSDSLLPMLLQVDCNPGSAKQGSQPGALLQLACM